jgi:hypothetical protein
LPGEEQVGGALPVGTLAEEVVGEARGVGDEVPDGDLVRAVDAVGHVQAADPFGGEVAPIGSSRSMRPSSRSWRTTTVTTILVTLAMK